MAINLRFYFSSIREYMYPMGIDEEYKQLYVLYKGKKWKKH